jgi:AcrR family transcriptional regulator
MIVSENDKRNQLHKRKAILDASRKMFYKKGVERTTIGEIAQSAGIAKGTMYLYFSSKEELIAALILDALKKVHEYTKEKEEEKHNCLDKIRAIGDSFIGFYRDYPEHFSVLQNNIDVFQKNIHAVREETVHALTKQKKQMIQHLVDIIEEGKKAETVRIDVDTLKTALIITQTSRMFIVQTLEQEKCTHEMFQTKREDLVTYFITMIIEAIKNK